MKRDEIIRIARKCGYWSGQTVEMNDVGLERFAALVAAAERDACAKVCLDVLKKWQESSDSSEYTRPDALDCADAIRERDKE